MLWLLAASDFSAGLHLSLTGWGAVTPFSGGSPLVLGPSEGMSLMVPFAPGTGTVQPGVADPNVPTPAWLVRPLSHMVMGEG